MSSLLLEKSKTLSLAKRPDFESSPLTLSGPKVAELEIARLARVVWSKLGYVLLCAVALAAAGYAVARWQKPVYRSSATIELLGVNSDFLNLREVQPNASSNATGTSEAYLQTEIELFGSKALLARTLTKLGKLSDPARSPGALSGTDAVKRDQLIESYSKRLRIEQVRESNLLQITFDDGNPAFAAEFVNTLIEEAVGKNIEDRWKSNERLGVLFSKQVSLLRARMEAAEKQLQDYGRQSGLLYTGENDSVAESRLTAIEEELSRAQAERIQKESRYKLTLGADPNSVPEILSSETMRQYESKLADLRRERAELAATMTPQNPRILKVDAQIQDVQATITREHTNVINGVLNDYDAAKHREQMLSSASASQAGKVSEQSQKAIHYDTLKREVDTTRGLYEAMLRRMNDAEVMSTINASDIRVVDGARAPLTPAKPNKVVYTALGFLNGLLLPLLFLFIQEYRNRTIQAPGHTPAVFQLTELGVIPSAKASRRVLDFPGKEGARGALLAPRSQANALSQSHDLSGDLLKDSFRGIATSILINNPHTQKPLTLVVSSPHEAEGKTTTVINVGRAMATIGRRVLLIDGDLRRPTLHRFFGLSNGAGLASLLSEENASTDPSSTVCATDIENLSVLTAGEGSEMGTGWLHSEKVSAVLNKLGKQFDLILIDSGPILLMPETRIIAKASDGLVLVFRAGKTNYEDAMAACQRALQDGTSVFGTILNDWKPERNQYTYYARQRA